VFDKDAQANLIKQIKIFLNTLKYASLKLWIIVSIIALECVIPVPLNYCSLVLVKILHACVALNPNSQLLLNRAPCPDIFLPRTTRSQT